MMESYCFTISLYHNVNRTTPLPHLRLRPHWSLARWKMCPWSALSSILGGPRKDMISCWNWILRKHIQYIHTTIQQTHKHGAERYLPRLAHDCRVWEHQVSPLKTRTDSGMGFIDQCQGFDLPMISWVEIHISGVHPTLSPWSPQRFWALCGSQGARPRLRLMWRIWTSNLWRARCGFRVYVNLAEGTMIYDVGMAKPRMNFCLLWKDWESFDYFFCIPSSIPQNNIPSSKVLWITFEPAESASVLKRSPQFMSRQVPDPEDPAAEQVGCCISDFETFHIWVNSQSPKMSTVCGPQSAATQESGPKDEKVPDSKRFQSLFGASRKSTNRQSKAKVQLLVSGHTESNRGWYGSIPSQTETMIWIDMVWYGMICYDMLW